MTIKKYIQVSGTILSILLVARFLSLLYLVQNPRINLFNEKLEKVDIKIDVVEDIKQNINHFDSPWSHNPLTFFDYSKIFFNLQDCDPEITIVQMSANTKGYRVSVHGYLDNYYVVYYLNESGDVLYNQLKTKH